MKSHAANISTLSDRLIQFGDKYTPGFRTCKHRCKELATLALTSKSNLALLTHSGVLIAIELPLLWDEKKFTQIAVLDGTPPALAELLDECINWWQSRKSSQMLCYTALVDSEAMDVLVEFGFKQQGTMLVRSRYGHIQ